MQRAIVHSNADTRGAFWDPDLAEGEADSLADAGIERYHGILRALVGRRFPLADLDIRYDPTVSGLRQGSVFQVWTESGWVDDEAATEQLLELEQSAFQAAVEGATTLGALMSEAGCLTYCMTDRGNGCAWGDNGASVTLTEDDDGWDAEVVDTVMYPQPEPATVDGAECRWASDWIQLGEGDNPYRVRVWF